MLGSKEKALLHIYAAAAGLNEPTYRNVLVQAASVSSAADRRFSQHGFEQAMAALETMLFSRVAQGLIPSPIGRNRWIRSEYYWRNKLPKTGFLNSRQSHKISALWIRLKEFLPESECSAAYLNGIISHAVGREAHGWASLTAGEAGAVIDALTDRLAHAIRSPVQSEVPF